MEYENLVKASQTLVREIISLKKGEHLLIISDFSGKWRIIDAIGKESIRAGAEVYALSFNPLRENELPDYTTHLINHSDAIILVSGNSLSFSPKIWKALGEGKRVVSCPRTDEDMFYRALSVNPKILAMETRKVASVLTSASLLEIVSDDRKSFEASVSGREAVYVDGLADEPGKFTIIPGGILGIAPLEMSAEGELYINGSISHIGVLSSPISLKVEKGEIVDIRGDGDAKKFEKLLDSYGDRNMYKIAEIGVGVHPRMNIRGNATEDESARGAVIIGIGENTGHLRGNINAPDHIDLTIKGATLKIDGELELVKEGRLEVPTNER